MTRAAAIVLAAGLTACATTATDPDPPAGPPSLVPAPGRPAPPQARLYIDCIVQAAGVNSYDREENLIRFHCSGPPAQAFYAGIGAWSARQGSQYDLADGRVVRFTARVREDPTGLDFCSVDASGGDARCTVVLNIGEFLDS